MTKHEMAVNLAQRENGRIHVRIIDAESGLTELQNVWAVRVHSKNLNVLIMNDYLPTLGQIIGDVFFLDSKGEKAYRGISGFYKHQHNEFTLLVEEYLTKGADVK